jgi:ABC-type bacteriocin/lantibiotic exporter with double-glycine peptidase domain
MHGQAQTNWCWIAVSVSINLYYDHRSRWTQCKLVNYQLGRNDCCTNGGSSSCNVEGALDDALTSVGNLNYVDSGKASLNDIENEINNCRIVAIRIEWDSSHSGHFVAIYGYKKKRIYVADPIYGESVHNYNSFPSNYQGGADWTATYYTMS